MGELMMGPVEVEKNSITLAEALPLLKSLENHISELTHERDKSSYVLVDKEDLKSNKIEYPARTVDQITAEIEQAHAAYRKLMDAVARANLTNTIEWEGERITIAEALELAKWYRQEAGALKRLAWRRKQEYETKGLGESNLIRLALYEPEEMRRRAMLLTRKANKLSALIEVKNHSVYLTVEGLEKYLEL